MLHKLITLTLLVFALGWLSHILYDDFALAGATTVLAEPIPSPETATADTRQVLPSRTAEVAAEPVPFTNEAGPRERPSPADRLTIRDIHVTDNRVIIDGVTGRRFETAIFTDTNSMDPWIDDGAQAIQIVPLNENEIKIGDIISYDAGQRYGVVIHQVIEIGHDNQGWFAVVKGINNPAPDPVKVRFPMIRRVLVGVLY